MIEFNMMVDLDVLVSLIGFHECVACINQATEKQEADHWDMTFQ